MGRVFGSLLCDYFGCLCRIKNAWSGFYPYLATECFLAAGPVDYTQSQLTVSPTTAYADGNDIVTITSYAKDISGNPVANPCVGIWQNVLLLKKHNSATHKP
jgi:hypothetical protein